MTEVISNLQDLNKFLRQHASRLENDDNSSATHMMWDSGARNPLVPTYCTLKDSDFLKVNSAIVRCFYHSFDRNTGNFFPHAQLPCIHEIAKEFFPVFLDLDHIPVSASMSDVKGLVTRVCDNLAQKALEVPLNSTVTVFCNNPSWLQQEENRCPRSEVPQEKYGVHLYFNPNTDGERATSITPIMKGIAAWLNEDIKGLCEHKNQTSDERKQNKECLYCQTDVDEGLFNKGIKPKLRMPYCDKGNPYAKHYYGLFFRLTWDGDKVRVYFSVR
jgi:hypothetical protein